MIYLNVNIYDFTLLMTSCLRSIYSFVMLITLRLAFDLIINKIYFVHFGLVG